MLPSLNIKERSIDSVLLLEPPDGWTNILRVMKPGAHLLLFSNAKNHHLGAIAAEDAGLEIRDTIAWVFSDENNYVDMVLVAMARKPLQGTVAENTLRYGTGGLNIDGCRIGGKPWKAHKATGLGSVKFITEGDTPLIDKVPHNLGRWPANLVLQDCPPVKAMFPFTKSGKDVNPTSSPVKGFFSQSMPYYSKGANYGDEGSAARFFYAAPSLDDLVAYLLKLTTPPNGTVLTNCDTSNLPRDYNYVTNCGY